jgi:hypothetical protein
LGKVSVIQEITGLDRNMMQKAKKNGLIKQRKGSNGIKYLLESIHPMFIKQKS